MPDKRHNVHIEVAPTEEGTFKAYCPEIKGLAAEGETPEAAEAVLTRLIETHMETEESVACHLDVAGDEDAVIGTEKDVR